MSEARPTSAVEVLTSCFSVLSPEEQEELLRACQSLWLSQLEEGNTEMKKMLASLQRVAEVLGETPGIDDYKRVRTELDEDLEPVSRILKHFHGSWHLAREALDLTETSTPRRIQERFASRRLGKIWRYTDETLKATVVRASKEIGHAPQVAEFHWWRERQIELAKSRGEDLHLPSAAPYRRRFGSWADALRAFGFSEDAINQRLEQR